MGSGVSEYERGALILSEPRGRFAYFAAMGKVGRRPGHGPLEQKNYLWRRNWEHFETARRGRRALRQNRNRPWFAVGAAALGGPCVFTALFCGKRQISS